MAEPGSVFQDSDLKQYLDHCGNLMSMHNVKVGDPTHLGLCPSWHAPVLKPSMGTHPPHQGPGCRVCIDLQCRVEGGAAPFREDRAPCRALTPPPRHIPSATT